MVELALACRSRPLIYNYAWLHIITNMHVVNISEIDHPLHGFAVYSLAYSVCLLFSYFSYALLDFSETGVTLYAYSTSTASFLLLNITPGHTLHSSVKDSITHNSIITLSSNFRRLVWILLLLFYEKVLLNQAHRPAHTWFLRIASVRECL